MASRTLSLAETNRGIDSEAQVTKTNEMNGKFCSEKLREDNITELKNMIASVLANMNKMNKELPDKMDKIEISYKNSYKILQDKLNERNKIFQGKFEINNEELE
jgi:hypothetical protein